MGFVWIWSALFWTEVQKEVRLYRRGAGFFTFAQKGHFKTSPTFRVSILNHTRYLYSSFKADTHGFCMDSERPFLDRSSKRGLFIPSLC